MKQHVFAGIGLLFILVLAAFAVSCGGARDIPLVQASPVDAGADAAIPAEVGHLDAGSDAAVPDAGNEDAGTDVGSADRCVPSCEGKSCGDDDGCGGRCMDCSDRIQICDMTTWKCCIPNCSGKSCGGDDGCGGRCRSCPHENAFCDQTEWSCKCSFVDCFGKSCGDDDGCGGKCGGACPALMLCNQTTYACEVDPCVDQTTCSAACPGTCPNAGEECRLDPVEMKSFQCTACNPSGIGVGEVCSAREDCACGGGCANPLAGHPFCILLESIRCDEVAPPQNQCLQSCLSDGSCSDDQQTCTCLVYNAYGTCLDRKCFTTRTIKGSFSSGALKLCHPEYGPSPFGSGSIEIQGVAGKVTEFGACRLGDDYIVVAGYRGTLPNQADLVLMTLKTEKIYHGAHVDIGAALSIRHDNMVTQMDRNHTTFVDPYSVKGVGLSGSIVIDKADLNNGVSGTVDAVIGDYEFEVCGGSTGVKCPVVISP